MNRLPALLLSTLFVAASGLLGPAHAGPKIKLVNDAPNVKVEQTIANALRVVKQSGRPIEVVLNNGRTYVGVIRDVSDHAVIVGPLSGKEFYDAYVRIEQIAALEYRVRTF